MIRRTTWFIGFCMIIANLGGCGIGYNRMLFATKTNVGFDVDTKPPVVQLNINRLEGVIAPQFENGNKLPVMASFKFRNSDSFSPHVGSAFATGDAAVTLAALYNEDTPGTTWKNRLEMARGKLLADGRLGKPDFDSSLTLKKKPTIQDNVAMLFAEKGKNGEYYQQTDVRPVFFGTDTSLGLKIAWSGAAGVFPDSAKLGFNRKELAWVPISMKQEGTGYSVKTSSLLATVDSEIGQPVVEEGAPKIAIQYMQYFATGDAATLLAMQKDVRKAMLMRLDPNQEQYASLAIVDHIAGVFQLSILNEIHQLVKNASEFDPVAVRLLRNLDDLEALVPSKYAFWLFEYDPNPTPSELKVLGDITKGADVDGYGFLKFTDYLDYLQYSIEAMDSAVNTLNANVTVTLFPGPFDTCDTIDLNINDPADDDEINRLRAELKAMQTHQLDIRKHLANQPAIRRAALYVLGQSE